MENNNSTEYKKFKDRIYKSIFYKLDCDFLNNNIEEITFLAFIYTLAGITLIDVPASPKAVSQAKKAIDHAVSKANHQKVNIEYRPYLIASIRSSTFSKKDEYAFKSLLDQCIYSNVDGFEIHIDTINIKEFKQQLEIIKELQPPHLISISVSRKKLSNTSIIDLIKLARETIKTDPIVEVEGINDDSVGESYNTTLQTISTADIINKQLKLKDRKFRKLPIILSGGTNSLTLNLAEQCGVPFNGINLGLYSKRSLQYLSNNYTEIRDFELNLAIESAKKLIK